MIRAAVCGLGIGMAHCAGYLAASGAELVAVCDLLPERLRRVGGTFEAGSMLGLRDLFDEQLLSRRWEEIGVRVFSSLEELLEYGGFDLLSLCTPDYLHGSQSLEVLQAGRHLLLEKPVALSRSEAILVQRAAAEAGARGQLVGVGYEFRQNPAILKVKELIKDGTVGSVEAVSIHHFRTPFKRDKWQKWIQSRQLSGGLIVEETSHWFDLLRYLTSRDVVDLHCVTTDRIHADFDFEDVAFAGGHLTGGAAFQIEHSLAGFDFSFTIAVYGTRGSVYCGLKEERLSVLDGGQTDYIGIVSWGDSNESADRARSVLYGAEAREPETIRQNVVQFVERLVAKRAPSCTVADGVRALELSLLAGIAAARNEVVAAKEVDNIE